MDPKIVELENRRTKLLKDAEDLANKAGATAEELAQADGYLDQAEQLQAEIATLKSQDHRKERIAKGRAVQAAAAKPESLCAGGGTATLAEEPRLPAIPKSHGPLKAFKGTDGDRLAYAFGAFCLGLTNLPCASHYRGRAEELGMSYQWQEQLAHGAGTPASGGYLVRETVGAVINMLRLEYGVARRECELVEMGDSEIVNSPIVKTGLRVYPAHENTERTASDMTFGNVELISRDWACMSIFSNKINDLAVISLGDTIANDMGYQFAINEDTCCFLGDGTSIYQQMQGVIHKLNQAAGAGSIAEAAAGNLSFGTLDLADFAKTTALLPKFAGLQPKWYIHKSGWELSMQLLALAGGMLSPAGSVQPTFLGYPVVFVEVMPKGSGNQASTILALFGDLRLACKFGNRQKVLMASSSDRYFEKSQTAVKGECSFAFNAYRTGSATEAGPIIGLKTPAA